MAPTVAAEAFVPFDGETYRLVFDWGAIEHFEMATGQSFAEFLIHLSLAEAGAAPMPLMMRLAQFVQAGLHRHHPDVDRETAFAMWSDEGVRNALTGAADKATAGATAEASGKPGEPRPAAAKPSTRAKRGAGSSRRGSKRASG